MGKNELFAITIVEKYDDYGPKEARYTGFLTSPHHAMFVDQNCGTLMIVEVNPTNDSSVYLTASPTMELGHVEDPSKYAETIKTVAESLNNMPAYQFVVKILLNLRGEVNFEDKIVPVPGGSNFMDTTFESRVM
jgi:hypothetical protein